MKQTACGLFIEIARHLRFVEVLLRQMLLKVKSMIGILCQQTSIDDAVRIKRLSDA
jgi:hypothetical protein